MKGVVTKLPDVHKCWGFIQSLDEQDLPTGEELFYHVNDVQIDCIGRRHLSVGDILDFEPRLKDGRLRATNVMSLSARTINPLTHKEWSFISKWSRADGVEQASAWLQRDTGDQLVLFPDDIVDFKKLEPHLRVNLWVFHSVAQSAGRCNSRGKFHAKHAQVYVPAINGSDFVFDDPEVDPGPQYPEGSIEAHFLNLPDTEPAIETGDSNKPGVVYAATEPKLSLREIIRRRAISGSVESRRHR
jgi:hypothetical protein